MRSYTRWLLLLYGLISLFHIFSIAAEKGHWVAITKPMLLGTLLFTFGIETRLRITFSRLLAVALFFCWLGDVLLMKKQLFIHGLSAFLTGHIFYIMALSKIPGRGMIQRQLLKGLPAFAYFVIITMVLVPYLDELIIPVILYALVISLFLTLSLNLFGKTDRGVALFFFIGASLFVVSDTILALNKFVGPVPASGIWVMTTYCTAQLLIVYAAIRYNAAHR